MKLLLPVFFLIFTIIFLESDMFILEFGLHAVIVGCLIYKSIIGWIPASNFVFEH